MCELRQAAPGITRPALRPDLPLALRASGLQIGAGSVALYAPDVAPGALAWLRTIDGTRSWEQLDEEFTQAGPVDCATARRLLRLLTTAGGLDDAASLPRHWRWVSAEHRLDHLGDRTAAAWLYRDPHAADVRMERRHAHTVGVRGDGQLADAVRAALERSGLSTTEQLADAWVIVTPGPPDVVVDPGPGVDETPHLVCSLTGCRGVVGPLVVPGRTSCLRCRHLHLLDADPEWPLIALQLAGQRRLGQPSDRLLVDLLATFTALTLRRWVDEPEDIDAWGNIAMEVALPDGRPTMVHRPPHPACGCQWPQA